MSLQGGWTLRPERRDVVVSVRWAVFLTFLFLTFYLGCNWITSQRAGLYRLWFGALARRKRRYLGDSPGMIVSPTVVGTLKPAFAYPAQGQRRIAMQTPVLEGDGAASFITEKH
jgi:hypothetical protein